MNCFDSELLHKLFDHQLTPVQVKEIEDHAKTCTKCAKHLKEFAIADAIIDVGWENERSKLKEIPSTKNTEAHRTHADAMKDIAFSVKPNRQTWLALSPIGRRLAILNAKTQKEAIKFAAFDIVGLALYGDREKNYPRIESILSPHIDNFLKATSIEPAPIKSIPQYAEVAFDDEEMAPDAEILCGKIACYFLREIAKHHVVEITAAGFMDRIKPAAKSEDLQKMVEKGKGIVEVYLHINF